MSRGRLRRRQQDVLDQDPVLLPSEEELPGQQQRVTLPAVLHDQRGHRRVLPLDDPEIAALASLVEGHHRQRRRRASGEPHDVQAGPGDGRPAPDVGEELPQVRARRRRPRDARRALAATQDPPLVTPGLPGTQHSDSAAESRRAPAHEVPSRRVHRGLLPPAVRPVLPPWTGAAGKSSAALGGGEGSGRITRHRFLDHADSPASRPWCSAPSGGRAAASAGGIGGSSRPPRSSQGWPASSASIASSPATTRARRS